MEGPHVEYDEVKMEIEETKVTSSVENVQDTLHVRTDGGATIDVLGELCHIAA